MHRRARDQGGGHRRAKHLVTVRRAGAEGRQDPGRRIEHSRRGAGGRRWRQGDGLHRGRGRKAGVSRGRHAGGTRRRQGAGARARRCHARGERGRHLAHRQRARGDQAVKLAEFSVRRWQFTILMFLMLAALGVASWIRIPRGEDPIFPIPIFNIVAVYPGASPFDMEQLVVDKIEDRLGALEQVKKLTSKAEDGLAVLQLEFEPGVDADRQEDAVLREMNALRPELPAGLARLQITRASGTNVNILQAAVVSETAPYAQMDSIAKRIQDRLERVVGVKKSERWAAPPRQVQVALDLDRLARLGVPPMQVM